MSFRPEDIPQAENGPQRPASPGSQQSSTPTLIEYEIVQAPEADSKTASAPSSSTSDTNVPAYTAPLEKDCVVREKRRRVSRDKPTSFFIKSEGEIGQYSVDASRLISDSHYGVESLADAISTADRLDKAYDERRKSSRSSNDQDAKIHYTAAGSGVSSGMNPKTPPSQSPQSSPNRGSPKIITGSSSVNTMSLPLTPNFAHSPSSAPMSTPRSTSLRSFKLSDDESGIDDGASQAIASSEEEDDGEDDIDYKETPTAAADGASPHFSEDHGLDASAVQLVMPSINMPTRRPFTEIGKQMGKLKILIAGGRGVGKSSLVRSIVQTCEHIVHSDCLMHGLPRIDPSGQSPQRPSQHRPLTTSSSAALTEVTASTRAYPTWWSGLEDSRVMRRRKSSGDPVLERNLTFVDTLPFDENDTVVTGSTMTYIENQFRRNANLATLSDSDVLNILSGNGGVSVDLTLYICTAPPSDVEKRCIQQLSSLTNLILIAGKVDTLSASALEELVTSLSSLKATLYESREVLPSTVLASSAPLIYTVSSLPQSTTNMSEMDASLMMSPDYVQPLHSSHLPQLVSHIFKPESTAYLRHTTARKFLAWRTAAVTSISALSLPCPDAQSGQQAANTSAFTPYDPSNELASSFRSTDADNRSEYTASSVFATSVSPSAVLVSNSGAQVRIARWASDLQRALDAERRRHAGLGLTRWASDLQRVLDAERRRHADLESGPTLQWLGEKLAEIEATLAAVAPTATSESPLLMASDAAISTSSSAPSEAVEWGPERAKRAKGDASAAPTAAPAPASGDYRRTRRRRMCRRGVCGLGMAAWSCSADGNGGSVLERWLTRALVGGGVVGMLAIGLWRLVSWWSEDQQQQHHLLLQPGGSSGGGGAGLGLGIVWNGGSGWWKEGV